MDHWEREATEGPTKRALDESSLVKERNKIQDPTEGQAEAGNYRKGHVTWQGLQIAIETPKNGLRKGKNSDGSTWEIKLKYDYGDFTGTTGADGDPIDVIIGPVLDSELVHIVNQLGPGGKGFDEHKVVIGCVSKKQAEDVYLSNYEKGWTGLGEVTPVTVSQFKWWVKNGTKSKPIEDGKFAKRASDDQTPFAAEAYSALSSLFGKSDGVSVGG